jgi:hypothetical protein
MQTLIKDCLTWELWDHFLSLRGRGSKVRIDMQLFLIPNVFTVRRYKKNISIMPTGHSVIYYSITVVRFYNSGSITSFHACISLVGLQGQSENDQVVVHLFSGRSSGLRTVSTSTQVHWVFSCCIHRCSPAVSARDNQVLSSLFGRSWQKNSPTVWHATTWNVLLYGPNHRDRGTW